MAIGQIALDPPDPKQCQSLKPNGYNAFTLGGKPGYARCEKKPSVIVTENQLGDDGLIGSMSLCADCLDVFNKQKGPEFATVSVIKEADHG